MLALSRQPLSVTCLFYFNVQVVLVSSMGICDAENRLNKIGDGNILIWKRRAERYLIARGFPAYTIIHPGGLLDAPVRTAIFMRYMLTSTVLKSLKESTAECRMKVTYTSSRKEHPECGRAEKAGM